MSIMILNTCLIISLLFAIKYVRDFFQRYESFLKLKDDLAHLIKHVETTIEKADSTTRTFQEQIDFTSHNIIPHMPKAHTVQEDLSFLTDHGNSIADRLEALTREAKRTFLNPQSMIFSKTIQKENDNVVALDISKEEEIASNSDSHDSTHTTVHDDGSTTERRGFYTTLRRAQ